MTIADLQHELAAVEVAELAVQRPDDGRGEQVRRDDPGQMLDPAEVADDRRQRGRDDRLVERREQQHEQQRAEDQADATLLRVAHDGLLLAAPTWRSWASVRGGRSSGVAAELRSPSKTKPRWRRQMSGATLPPSSITRSLAQKRSGMSCAVKSGGKRPLLLGARDESSHEWPDATPHRRGPLASVCLGLDDVLESTVARMEDERLLDEPSEATPWIRLLERGRGMGDELLVRLFEHGVDQVLASRKMAVERSDAEPRLPGDLAHRHLDPGGREELPRRRDEPFTVAPGVTSGRRGCPSDGQGADGSRNGTCAPVCATMPAPAGTTTKGSTDARVHARQLRLDAPLP